MKERLYNHFVYVDENDKIILRRGDFIKESFITTNDKTNKLHTETICDIFNKKGFKLNIAHVAKLINVLEIGKYNRQCNINGIRKGGFEYIKYIG